jgi:hypothetical protein
VLAEDVEVVTVLERVLRHWLLFRYRHLQRERECHVCGAKELQLLLTRSSRAKYEQKP